MTNIACITGITGQTGSYLAELLLNKGYKVYGLKRRSSSFNTERLDHIYQDKHINDHLELIYGDLADYSSLVSLLGDTKPDLFFNMGAMSHVRVSFDIPEYTMDVTGTGVMRCLEAIRKVSPQTRFLQASSSEMFGAEPPPQHEKTPFHPRSPYAVAKVAGYYATINYREAYGMFATNAISFNKECVAANTPIMVRINGIIDIVRPKDLIPLRGKGANKQVFDINNVEIWDGTKWTKIKSITATKRNKSNKEHDIIGIQTRAGVINVTKHHNMLDYESNEIEAQRCSIGDRLLIAENMPSSNDWTVVSSEMAELLGLLVADGFVSQNDRKVQFTNNDIKLQLTVKTLWSKLFLGTTTLSTSPSGFKIGNESSQLHLNGCADLCHWLRSQIYTEDGFKKIPQIILNAPKEIQASFIKGYYAGDGLKKGNGQSFGTNSSVLALGLCWLYFLQGNKCTIYQDNHIHKSTGPFFKSNILTNSKTGTHLRKDPSEIRKIDDYREIEHWTNDWVFDLETESQIFMAGVGRLVIHNSPRRGETFVTRKITRAATRIKLGLQDKLYLGNLSAKRDWHHAQDAARAMIMMLEANEPDDYCIAAGEMHSVQEFVELVFEKLDLDWKQYVVIDPKYFRPSEVDALCGDSTKLRTKLGWAPQYTFDQLVDEMISCDMKLATNEKLITEQKDAK